MITGQVVKRNVILNTRVHHRICRRTEMRVPVRWRIERTRGSQGLGLPRRHRPVPARLSSLKNARAEAPTRDENDRDEKGIA